MKLCTEEITLNSRYWTQIQALDTEAFPKEEYIAPEELVKMSEQDDFSFLA